jgi:hypothetical protein
MEDFLKKVMVTRVARHHLDLFYHIFSPQAAPGAIEIAYLRHASLLQTK